LQLHFYPLLSLDYDKHVYVSDNFDGYVVGDSGVSRLLRSFGFSVNSHLPCAFQCCVQPGECQIVKTSLYICGKRALTSDNEILEVYCSCEVALDRYRLYYVELSVLESPNTQYAWVLLGYSDYHFVGSVAHSDGLRGYATPEFASVMLSGLLKDFIR